MNLEKSISKKKDNILVIQSVSTPKTQSSQQF